jgi:hypothetical protein
MTPDERKAYMRAYYLRRKANGGDRLTPAFDMVESFLSRVDTDQDGCWEWDGWRDASGYGRMRVGRISWLAHRLSYALHNGDLPAGCFVCHHCDNPPCVNPTHLYAGNYQTNGADMVKRDRLARLHGEESGTSKLTESQVRQIRDDYAQGLAPQRVLAKKHGISPAQVYNIVHAKQWKHIA